MVKFAISATIVTPEKEFRVTATSNFEHMSAIAITQKKRTTQLIAHTVNIVLKSF